MRMRRITAILSTALLALLAACDSGSESVDLLPPELSGPVDLSSFQARSFVEFSWLPVEGASSYEISFDYDDYPEENIILATQVPITVYELAEIGSIRWRVRAMREGSPGPWSETRSLVSRPTELLGSLETALTFSTSGLQVGEEVVTRSEVSLFEAIIIPVIDFNASQRDVRDVRLTNFDIEITEPAGTVMDQFAGWQVTVRNAAGEQQILALTDPAPAESSISIQVFQRPVDWLSVALDPATEIAMRATINPRSPKEATVSWRLRIDLTVLVNR